MLKYIGILFCCLSVQLVNAQSISGKITDKENGKTLQGVSIRIANTSKGVVSNETGIYSLTNITEGKLHLLITYTGYGNIDTTINIVGKANQTFDFALEAEKGELEEVIIVSSSRTNSRIEDLPTKVEVLGSEEVKEENGIKPGNIASLLGDIAGIQIQQTSAATGNADMRIQGLQGKYTQILRDGMPLFGGYAGSFSILQIPPLDLQQIELVKGASSTLYGGGAIAGMLNLISKKPKLGKPEKSVTLNYSNLNEANANTFFSGRNKELGYTLYAGTTQQKEMDVDGDGFSDVPTVKNVFVHPRFFIYGKDNSTLTLGYTFNYEDRNGGDMSVLKGIKNTTHQYFDQNKTTRNTADAVWEKKYDDGGMLTAKANYSIMDRAIITNAFGMGGKQSSWYSELAYSKKMDAHTLVMGVNFNGEAFTKKTPDSSFLPNTAFNTLGAFIQDDWKMNNAFTLQSGLRIDQNNDYGTFVLPRLSLMYKVNPKVTMRIGGGEGYKTPSLFSSELDERDIPNILGFGQNIKSEKSLGANYDINYKTKIDEWELTLNQTFFYNQIDNPITYQLAPIYTTANFIALKHPLYVFANEVKALESKGMESYVQAMHGPLELYAGYVYTDAKRNYNSSNPNLPLIAKHKFATVLAYEFSEEFRAGIEASYTGKQYLDNGNSTKPYTMAAVMLRYNIGRASFVLNCENLFDERQNKNGSIVSPPFTNPSFPEIWAPLDGRVINLSMHLKW
jgi:iron complex outermembrane receptor protein/outer membrane receptor for ferrienterochelin and colicins